MNSKVNIKHLNNLNGDCLRGLEFYKQELEILQRRLDEIASRNTGKDVLIQVDHFQNQFIINLNYIDELYHNIHVNDEIIGNQLKKGSVFIDHVVADDHHRLYNEYLNEEKIVNELRHEFNRFAAKWM